MEETLRVKIVADVSQANSNLKTISKETNNISSSTDAATKSAQQLDKVFNSLGIRGLRLSGAFSGIATVGKEFNRIKTSVTGLGTQFTALGTKASLAFLIFIIFL